MKSMMLFYRLIVICFFVNFLVQAATLRPINKKNNIVKITDENKNTRTYYHLEKGNEMVFSNLEEFVEDPNETYSIKVITRAKISPNSNSNKIFGIELNILEDGIERNKVLKYKKGVSTAKKSSKSGFNFTQAGFWFDELKNIKNSEILIKLIDGSPPVDVRVVINPINFRSSDNILYPVNKEKTLKVLYKEELDDPDYKKSKGWYQLDTDSDMQYKIKGPKQIRVLIRNVLSEDSNLDMYGFLLRENGRYINEYLFTPESSNKEAHFIIDDEKFALSKYDSFFFNVPEGYNYYTFKSNNNKDTMLLKVQSYKDKK